MGKETLHTLRLIIPGLILFIILISLLDGNQGILDIKINTDSLLYIAVVFGLGTLFYVFNPRTYIMKNSLKKIDQNIKEKLTAPFAETPDIKNSIGVLLKGNKLINVFYYFIDTDKSLTERAKEVYFNGLIWSSLADLLIICPVAIILYIVVFLITRNFNLVINLYIAFGIGLVSYFIIPHVVKRHINFSNNQLTYIVDIHKKELHDKLIENI